MALLQRKLVGHQQVTDAYHLALAMHNKGRLATLDRKLTALLPEKTAARARSYCDLSTPPTLQKAAALTAASRTPLWLLSGWGCQSRRFSRG